MKKLLIALCVMSLACFHSFASTYRSLVIMTRDGGELSISYQKGMKMTFSNKTLSLAGTDVKDGLPVQFDYQFDDVTGFKFSEAEGKIQFAGLEETVNDTTSITIDGPIATICNLTVDTTVNIYSTSGRILTSSHADATGRAVINLHEYSNQVLIIQAGQLTYRIIIKQ